jgi:FAD:protein FMN transferase
MKKTIETAALACFALLFSCNQEKKYSRTFFALDTKIDVIVYSDKNPANIIDSLEKKIYIFDSSISISGEKSDVWKINHRSDSIVTVKPFTASMLSCCIAQADSTGGLFDITVAPLKYLYGLEAHQEKHYVPSQSQIDSIKRYVGIKHVKVLDDTTICIDMGVTVDFGGIAKGFLLTRIKNLFLDSSYKNFMVNLGGDLIAWGSKPDNRKWNIGVRHARMGNVNVAVIPVSNTCVFTSGDDERFFVRDGIIYHHLFDPRTCVPARKNRSSTVICPDPVAADVAVKAAFFMNAPDAIDYLTKRNIPGIMIDSADNVWASASLKGIMVPDSSVMVKYR